MKKFNIRIFILITLILFNFIAAGANVTPKTYINYIKKVLVYHQRENQNIMNQWKSNIQKSNLFGYSPTSYPASYAMLLGFMYQQTGDEKYVQEAVNQLLQYEEIKKLFPKEFYEDRIEYKKGLPPISDFFAMNHYPSAYQFIKSSKKIRSQDRVILEQGVADCANFLMNFPEWGAMNRAILRAEVFRSAANCLPNHPDTPSWLKMAKILASDSYQRWEEEDAASYHPVWLYSLFRYVSAAKDDNFFRSAIPRYYLDYYLQQMTPFTCIPDYGDAWWPGEFGRWIPIFEKGASVYREPRYKWAAEKFWNELQRTDPEAKSLGYALYCVDAIDWCDETVTTQPPLAKSGLIMDEMVGKKVVFRNGIDANSTYLMINYQDEGDGAFMGREFLRSTIMADEEKMHHGHSDENAIISLISKGSVLLDEAGYRDELPSGEYGGYRADYFHNRMVARKNKRWISLEGEHREQPLLEFLRNSGAYRSVETQLIDFLSFERIEFSRSRMKDLEMGYEWDRTVIYHKVNDFFIIIDGIKTIRRDYFTFTNLWHTQKVPAQGDHWFNTRIDNIQNWQNPGNQELLICFPLKESEKMLGTFDLMRHKQVGKTIYETMSGQFYENQMEAFVTVLVPHAPGADLEKIARQFEIIQSDKFPQAVGLKMNLDGREEYIGLKLDLIMDYSHQTVRPRYVYELGKVQYGPIETDGLFTFISKKDGKLYWACSNMTCLKFNEKLLHQSLKSSFGLQPTYSRELLYGYSKWRCWEEEVAE